jgi:hypothetical protein
MARKVAPNYIAILKKIPIKVIGSYYGREMVKLRRNTSANGRHPYDCRCRLHIAQAGRRADHPKGCRCDPCNARRDQQREA